jgi:hypothetical protein
MHPEKCARNPLKATVTCFLIILLMGINAGCMATKQPVTEPVRHYTGNRIVFLPVKNMSGIYGVRKSVISPISGTVFMTGDVMENAESIMTDCVTSALKNRRDLAVISKKQADAVMSSILTDERSGFTEKKRLAVMGRGMKADAVLVAYLYRFRQRAGNRHSVSTPASVAFELYLMDVSDESVIWAASYTETQQSLSEDLFGIKTFIKRRGQWVTAREIAVAGLEEILKDFPTK